MKKKRNSNWTSYDDMMLQQLEDFMNDMTNSGPEGLGRLAEFFTHAGDIDTGIKIMKQAAATGSLYALFWLGCIYKSDLYGKQDLEAAFVYFKESAERGYLYSMFYLVVFYYEGLGTDQDLDAYSKWMAEIERLDPDGRGFEEMKSMFEGCPEPELSSINQ